MVEDRKKPAGYKNTEVGMIPEEWEVVSFEEAFKFLSTGNNPRSELRDHGSVHYVHYGDIHTKWDKFLDCSKDTIPYIDEKNTTKMSKIKNGDLIMADASEDQEGIGVSVEVLNVNNKNVVAGLHTFLLRADKDIFADGFKGYIQEMKPIREELRKIATGISVYGISKTRLKKIKIPVPRFNEQQAIAEALGDMDDLVESVEKLIDKKQKIKEGAMQEFLTGKRRLPGFTGKWKKVRLEKLGIFGSGNGFPIKYQNNKNDRYPFFKVSDMNHKKNPIYMKVANHYISDQTRKKINASVFPKGTIIFAKIGAAIFLERKRILAQPSCIDNNVMGFTPDTDLCCNKLIYMMFINMELGYLAHTTALPSLSPNTVGAIELFIPQTIKEQQAIAQVLSDMDSDIEALEKKLNKYRSIKQGMMQELLTGRIRLI